MDKRISRGGLITFVINNKPIPVNCTAVFRVLQRHEAGERDLEMSQEK